MNFNKSILKRRSILSVCMLLVCEFLFASNDKDSIYTGKQIPFAITSSVYIKKDTSTTKHNSLGTRFSYLNFGDGTAKGLKAKDITVSGVVRSLMIYRVMGNAYDDMITGKKNISFADYPSANITSSARLGGGYPWMELNLSAPLSKKIDFSVGYSITPVFTGDVLKGNSRTIGARQNLNFSGKIRHGLFETRVIAGEVLWLHMSRFTMGSPEYRDSYFNRLPWDWYRNSFERFEEYYNFSSNIGAQQLGSNAVSGLIFETQYLPNGIIAKGFYGRTSWNVNNSEAVNFFPSSTGTLKLEKIVFERAIMGVYALNIYNKTARVNFNDRRPDNNTLITGDFDFKIKKINVSGEIGAGKLVNPGTQSLGADKWSPGFFIKTEFDNRVVLVPFSIEYYNISNGFVGLDGNILNSNQNAGGGGYITEKIYDNLFYLNIAQEVGQIANNRRGVNFKADGTLGKYLKFQLGYAFGSEIANLHDSITIQHRINDFTRSRMRPWFSAGGPYHRIQSNFFRTFEIFTIDSSKAGQANTYLKGFNALELLLKAKFKLFNHDIILLNFNSYNSVRKGFSPIAGMPNNKNTFVSVFFEDLTLALSLTPKMSLVGEAGFQTVTGSTMIDLSPDKSGADRDRIINQLGTVLAAGIDFDINRTMNVHLRQRYFTHKDFNFTKDKFDGHETTFELKIFF